MIFVAYGLGGIRVKYKLICPSCYPQDFQPSLMASAGRLPLTVVSRTNTNRGFPKDSSQSAWVGRLGSHCREVLNLARYASNMTIVKNSKPNSELLNITHKNILLKFSSGITSASIYSKRVTPLQKLKV
jgi:hypothetical protein